MILVKWVISQEFKKAQGIGLLLLDWRQLAILIYTLEQEDELDDSVSVPYHDVKIPENADWFLLCLFHEGKYVDDGLFKHWIQSKSSALASRSLTH